VVRPRVLRVSGLQGAHWNRRLQLLYQVRLLVEGKRGGGPAAVPLLQRRGRGRRLNYSHGHAEPQWRLRERLLLGPTLRATVCRTLIFLLMVNY